MRIVFQPPSEKEWEDFFASGQIGGHLRPFEGLRYQRGYGLGNFFGGLLRAFFPIMKSVGKTVGKQALRTGTAIAADALAGKNLKQAVKERGKAGMKRLISKGVRKIKGQQKGRGFGARPQKRTAQVTLTNGRRTRKKRSTVRKKAKRDQLGFYYTASA